MRRIRKVGKAANGCAVIRPQAHNMRPYNTFSLVKPAFAVLIGGTEGPNVYRPSRDFRNMKCACPNQARGGQQVAGTT